jgi:phenylacetic acid degradation operon negative regulatory protein
VPGGGDIPVQAFDLAGLRSDYEQFMTFAGRLRDTVCAGRVTPADALLARTRVMDSWRAFPASDPDLPAELLPVGWPRAAARELFIACYDLLGPFAAQHVRDIIAGYDQELAQMVAYHSSQLRLNAPAAGSATP